MRYFVVSDDNVVHAQNEIPKLGGNYTDYSFLLEINEDGLKIITGTSTDIAYRSRAIKSLEQFLNRIAPVFTNKHPLIGKKFVYENRVYIVFRLIDTGRLINGPGALLECITQEGFNVRHPWRYFTSKSITLYETKVRELIDSVKD
jgi:hypothetical protein